MTTPEVLEQAARAGLVLRVEGERIRAQSSGVPITPELKEGLKTNREQIVAILRLRDVHRAMGLSDDDIVFVERALLSGSVSEIRIVAQPCPTEPV